MALLPSGKEIKKFGKKNPIRSMVLIGFIGFTLVDVLSSFTLPRGKGPLTKYPAAVNQLQGSTSTSTSTSSSHPPHIVREALMNNNLAGFGMTKSQIKAKHPKGTKQSHIDRMHHHMERGMEFGPAHNRTVSDGFPAMGSVGSTSTTTSVSSTHLPPGLRRRMMSRTYESEVAGAHLGKQTLSVVDRAQESAEKNFGDMYGLAGITPEMGDGWTE